MLDGPVSNPGGEEIFRPIQTGPGAHPASCTMGPGLSRGRGVLLTTHPPSNTAVMEQKTYKSTHPLGHTGPLKGSLYLYIYFFFMLLILFFFLPTVLGRIRNKIKTEENKETIYSFSKLRHSVLGYFSLIFAKYQFSFSFHKKILPVKIYPQVLHKTVLLPSLVLYIQTSSDIRSSVLLLDYQISQNPSANTLAL